MASRNCRIAKHWRNEIAGDIATARVNVDMGTAFAYWSSVLQWISTNSMEIHYIVRNRRDNKHSCWERYFTVMTAAINTHRHHHRHHHHQYHHHRRLTIDWTGRSGQCRSNWASTSVTIVQIPLHTFACADFIISRCLPSSLFLSLLLASATEYPEIGFPIRGNYVFLCYVSRGIIIRKQSIKVWLINIIWYQSCQ